MAHFKLLQIAFSRGNYKQSFALNYFWVRGLLSKDFLPPLDTLARAPLCLIRWIMRDGKFALLRIQSYMKSNI
ncbi:hypothetical protein D5E86_18735 [Vibrio parahaemolyticus]|nr:hypothetical protein D5E86_18735 [Vibrio parahaemolyticus]TNZ99874.1 hypothetical protein CGK35_21770 [Vibrio parahaemolyticus]